MFLDIFFQNLNKFFIFNSQFWKIVCTDYFRSDCKHVCMSMQYDAVTQSYSRGHSHTAHYGSAVWTVFASFILCVETLQKTNVNDVEILTCISCIADFVALIVYITAMPEFVVIKPTSLLIVVMVKCTLWCNLHIYVQRFLYFSTGHTLYVSF